MKTVIPEVNLLKGCNSTRYNLYRTFTAHKISVVSKAISYSRTLIMKPKVYTPEEYFGFHAEISVYSALETRILVLLIFTRKSCDSSEVFQAASLLLRSTKESLKMQDRRHIVISMDN